MKTLRYAVRSLKKSPGFTAVAVVALALGIGANAAIFSLVEAIFLQPLPYEHPERLVQINSSAPEQGIDQAGFSWPRLEVLRERQQVFSDLSVSIFNAYTITGLGDPEQTQALMVSGNFFSLLGVEPALGRTFVAEEDKPGGPPVVILSNGFWRSHFGGQPDAIGKTLTLDGKPHTIVGVMPASVSSFPLGQTQLFTARPFEAPFLNRKQIDDGGFFFNVLGRLKPGVELAQVRAEMDVIQKSYAQTHASNVDAKSAVTAELLLDNLVGNQRGTYATLFGAVAAVLLIACANVANLVLARFSKRRKEIGIRVSLGARRAHIVAQLLAESMLLALAGAALGLAFAWASLRVVTRVGANLIPRADEIGLDPTVLAFTLGVALVTGLALGLLTALSTPIRSLAATVGDSSRGSTADRSRNRFHAALLVAEIAASFVLLVATGLLVSSFLKIRDVEPGFRSDCTFVGFVTIPAERYPWRDRIHGQLLLAPLPPPPGDPGREAGRALRQPAAVGQQRPVALRGDRPAAAAGARAAAGDPPPDQPGPLRPARHPDPGRPRLRRARQPEQPAGDHHQRGDGEAAVPEREPARPHAGHRHDGPRGGDRRRGRQHAHREPYRAAGARDVLPRPAAPGAVHRHPDPYRGRPGRSRPQRPGRGRRCRPIGRAHQPGNDAAARRPVLGRPEADHESAARLRRPGARCSPASASTA